MFNKKSHNTETSPHGVQPPFAEEIKSGKVYWYGKTCAERRRAVFPINSATDTALHEVNKNIAAIPICCSGFTIASRV